MENNLKTILDGHEKQNELEVIYRELIDFILKKEWRGACHESCGVQYVLLNEIGISCTWKLGEIHFKDKIIHGRNNIYTDHSWILINDKIFDVALLKTNYAELDSAATIKGVNLLTMQEPDVSYNANSGWEDSPETELIKVTPLSKYFDNSPLDKKIGTWALIQFIGRKIGISTSIVEMRKKYNDIFWI